MTALARAIDSVDMAHFVNEPDGRPLPQSSAPGTIASLIELAEVQPGDRVLEIGTGSGYSTALLAAIVGNSGTVTSVEVNPAVAARAASKLTEVDNATVICGDGGHGVPDAAPFDRLIAWTTPTAIPNTWTQQVTDLGVIVSPVKVAQVALANLTAKILMQPHGPGHVELHAGSFVDMTPEAADQTLPAFYLDATISDGDSAWLSSPMVRDNNTTAKTLLSGLITNPETTHAPPRTFHVLTAAFAASSPTHLVTASLGRTRGIGYVTDDSIAVVTSKEIIHHGTTTALDMVLRDFPTDEAQVADFTATLSPTQQGWSVTVTPPNPS